MKNRINADITITDPEPIKEAILGPFDKDNPDFRQAIIRMAGDEFTMYAYRPETLEQVADAMLKLAGEMRADRTAHQQREARKDDAINRTTAALDRFVSGQVAS